ncbi:MAG TPA: hypothetical protein VF173_19900 [Thermoanaerobaculia bacterium]|nr:hypothetical protein [Thermoanaerobaculia bacterium]
MAVIKTVGASGQIALGKQYAGRHVMMDEREPGVWTIKLGEFIPDNERWLHTPEVSSDLDEALAWNAKNPPQETNLKELEKRLLHEPKVRARSARSQ